MVRYQEEGISVALHQRVLAGLFHNVHKVWGRSGHIVRRMCRGDSGRIARRGFDPKVSRHVTPLPADGLMEAHNGCYWAGTLVLLAPVVAILEQVVSEVCCA